MYTEEQLLELGFVKDEIIEESGLWEYTKEVKDRVHLVVCPKLEEIFIWAVDEDYDDKDIDGGIVYLDLDTPLEKAIDICKYVVGVER